MNSDPATLAVWVRWEAAGHDSWPGQDENEDEDDGGGDEDSDDDDGGGDEDDVEEEDDMMMYGFEGWWSNHEYVQVNQLAFPILPFQSESHNEGCFGHSHNIFSNSDVRGLQRRPCQQNDHDGDSSSPPWTPPGLLSYCIRFSKVLPSRSMPPFPSGQMYS